MARKYNYAEIYRKYLKKPTEVSVAQFTRDNNITPQLLTRVIRSERGKYTTGGKLKKVKATTANTVVESAGDELEILYNRIVSLVKGSDDITTNDVKTLYLLKETRRSLDLENTKKEIDNQQKAGSLIQYADVTAGDQQLLTLFMDALSALPDKLALYLKDGGLEHARIVANGVYTDIINKLEQLRNTSKPEDDSDAQDK